MNLSLPEQSYKGVNLILIKALLPSEWVIRGRFSDGLEHTGQDFQAEILLLA